MNKSYLAAPTRYYLSATAKALLKYKILNPTDTHLDYGCGKGGDVERLSQLGYKSVGYDPYYFPLQPTGADVVTMGYVLNVIECLHERRQSLINAWGLASKCLIISTNVRGAGLHDGNITQIGTFTKSYKYVEFKAFVESTLGYEACKLDGDKLIVRRDGRQFEALHIDNVLREINKIKASGWVAPINSYIKSYCNGYYNNKNRSKRYYRLVSVNNDLPSGDKLCKILHIRGGVDSEHFKYCVEGLRRRNKIQQLKFHCIEQTFLLEFLGTRNFNFLDEEVKIYK
jgi:DNA phosphorothioation-associated putative methyltransferase